MSEQAPQQSSDYAHYAQVRREVISLEEKNLRLTTALQAARKRLEQVQKQLQAMNMPPMNVGILAGINAKTREADVVLAGKRMCLGIAQSIDTGSLSDGQQVLIDESMLVVRSQGFPRTGLIAGVLEIVGIDRVLVGMEGGQEHIVKLAGSLRHGNLRPGDSVIIDLRAGFAFERVTRADVEQLLTPEIPEVTYDDIGGLDSQIQLVRDAVELPFRHPELYRSYGLRPPKGILLYGPPGLGKTLIAKAVANSLSHAESNKRTYFLSIKGPELLNKFVGETERQIRSIFSRARALAGTNVPVVIFFDEMEALFRTRGSGVSSDVETMIVPQLLAEMDGVEALNNVVIIGASNRADMIDPAVLRPGRLDVRIRVERPDREGARDIFLKHLTEEIPIADSEIEQYGSAQGAIDHMIKCALDLLFMSDDSTALFDATLTSGKIRRIYLSDIVSGALIAGAVERAKKHAIKDTLKGISRGLTSEHVIEGVEEEKYQSMEISATTTPRDWAHTIGLREEVTQITPVGRWKE